MLYFPKKCWKGTKREKNEAAFQKILLISQFWKLRTVSSVWSDQTTINLQSHLQSIYTKNQVHDSCIFHPADHQTVKWEHQLESFNLQRPCCAVNLAERTTVKGSDRAKSRKPGNVKSQKSVEALKSISPPAEALLCSPRLRGRQWSGKETAGWELIGHLLTYSHNSWMDYI